VKLLAYLIGDGNLTYSVPRFTNTNPRIQEDFTQAVAEFPGLKVRRRDDGQRATSLLVSGDGAFIRSERQAFAHRLRSLVQRGDAPRLAAELNVSPSLIHFWCAGECLPKQELFVRL